MSYIKNMTYDGKDVVYINLSNVNKQSEFGMAVEEANGIIRTGKRDLLVCINVDGVKFTNPIIKLFTQFADNNKDYVRATAIIGVKGFIRMALNNMKKKTSYEFNLFNSDQEALRWITSK